MRCNAHATRTRNLPLWWQLRRLRFAIEVDCDARVLARRNEPRGYAETLLLVAQRRRAAAPLLAIALTEPASQLLRRIRILGAPTRRRSRMLLAGALMLGAACIAGAAALQAPATLATQSLRKPPDDPILPPHCAQAETAARARFPELFTGHFDGQAEIAVGLDRQGTVLDVESRAYSAPDKAVVFLMPPWFASSWARGHGFELQDVMEHYDRLEAWHGPQHVNKLYLTYDVIKWPHDPTRSAARVRAAVLGRYPQLVRPPSAAVAGQARAIDNPLVTVVMSDDGTIKQARFGRDHLRLDERFRAMGFDPRQLVHRGVIGHWLTQTQHYCAVYAWPRRPQDPPGESLGLGFWQGLYLYPRNSGDANSVRMERERNTVDRVLVQRYFPDFWQHGATRPHEWLWLLLDRSGRVFAAGTADAADNLSAIQTALFPGVTVGAVGYSYGYGYQFDPPQGRSAMLMFGWLGPDSPITSPSQADPSRRSDLLIMADIRRGGQPVAGLPIALDFGTPAVHTVSPGVRLSIEADAARGGAVDLHLRLLTSQDQPSSALSSGPSRTAAAASFARAAADPWSVPGPSLRVMPEQQAALQLSDAQGQSWRVTLRVDRLAGLLRYPVP